MEIPKLGRSMQNVADRHSISLAYQSSAVVMELNILRRSNGQVVEVSIETPEIIFKDLALDALGGSVRGDVVLTIIFHSVWELVEVAGESFSY